MTRLALLLPILISSCALPPPPHYAECRHTALMAATIYAERGHETRIAEGPGIRRPNILHAQAQARIGGEWAWLSVDARVPIRVWAGTQEPFRATNFFGRREYDFRLTRRER